MRSFLSVSLYRFDEDGKRAFLADVVPMESGHNKLTGLTSWKVPQVTKDSPNEILCGTGRAVLGRPTEVSTRHSVPRFPLHPTADLMPRGRCRCKWLWENALGGTRDAVRGFPCKASLAPPVPLRVTNQTGAFGV